MLVFIAVCVNVMRRVYLFALEWIPRVHPNWWLFRVTCFTQVVCKQFRLRTRLRRLQRGPDLPAANVLVKMTTVTITSSLNHLFQSQGGKGVFVFVSFSAYEGGKLAEW